MATRAKAASGQTLRPCGSMGRAMICAGHVDDDQHRNDERAGNRSGVP